MFPYFGGGNKPASFAAAYCPRQNTGSCLTALRSPGVANRGALELGISA
ncbi:MAG: hypothetical protein MUC97_04845 [Bernardetiaceae bacterium]|nr:hypothetical protein [Bernardetiaceae bacterium]